jgi:membrane-associated phospholipid phosphatase
MVTLRKPWLVGLLVLALVVYVSMWLGWASGWGWLHTIDSSSLLALHRFGTGHPAWLTFWNVFCTVFGPLGFRLIVLVPIVLAVVRRQWRVAVFLFVCVELSGLLTLVAKAAANRPRPETAFVVAASSSFPSGHALCAMAGVLAISVVVLPMIRRAWWPLFIATGVAIVVTVGFGRVALNVHNPSDVVAGWALGYVYFVGCLLLLVPRQVKAAVETPAALGSAP